MNGEYEVRFLGEENSALFIFDPSGNKLHACEVKVLLNRLHLENKKLKKEIEDWKEECLYLENNK